jgi:Zn ribbon nucleic-acid-binding protein
MTAKTYTKRENAKRAAIAAGVPAELVEITVHKSADGVRFGWRAMEAPAPAAEAAPADAVVTTTPTDTSDDHCPLCNGDPSSQTWANEGVSCLCHKCGKTWSVKTRKEVRTGLKIEKERIEQNGVKRPSAGGLCAAVWEWLDENGNCMPKDLKPVAEAKGWNLNNAQIELYQWRKFMGLGRVTN